ncbi:MAG: glucose-1-phosphate adenylyltransferase [bacterium]
MQDVLAIVLGGGRGSRLYPLTKLRAKPAVPLASKYRLIDIPISNCINSGLNRIFVLTQFLSASLHRHVYDTYKFDVFAKGFVEILPAEQTHTSKAWYQGTADAVRRQMHRFVSREPEDVLILAGDHLYRMDYAEFLQFHRASGAEVTTAVFPVEAQEASRFGILKTDRRGRITDFREKPRRQEDLSGLESETGTAERYLASMGIYIFKMPVLKSLLDEIAGDDFGTHILPKAIGTRRVHAFLYNGYWVDIGTISSFYDANLALTRSHPPFDFYDPRKPIYTRSRFLPPSLIEDCRMRRAAVADGCRLQGAEIEESIVGLRSIIYPGARLSQVVMMGADYYEDQGDIAGDCEKGWPPIGIGGGSRIERAIIDKNARIGHGVVIRSRAGEPDREEDTFALRDGIVVIPKNTVIPDGTVI